MDMSAIASNLGLSSNKPLIRMAEELRRVHVVHFDSSMIGVGEVCKAIICLEIAADRMHVMFERQSAIRMSGMSENAYMRSFNAMLNGIGVKASVDPRDLLIQLGTCKLISFMQKGLSLYQDRFLSALPASGSANTDFDRPVFYAVAFYLGAKRHNLKVDKLKLVELSGTSESEFDSVSTSMNDLCSDVFGISKDKKDSSDVKLTRQMLDFLPGKRRREDDADGDDILMRLGSRMREDGPRWRDMHEGAQHDGARHHKEGAA